MFKQQRYHIIFIILLLILALQFQLLLPAYDCQSGVSGTFRCVQTPKYLRSPSSLRNLRVIHFLQSLKSSDEWEKKKKKKKEEITSSLRIRDGGQKRFSRDTKANDATEVQSITILIKTWPSPEQQRNDECLEERRGSLFQSAVHQLTCSSVCPSLIRESSSLLIGYELLHTLHGDTNAGGSSWVAIGRWHPAGSWRRLRGREPPSTSASCSPFVNCREQRKPSPTPRRRILAVKRIRHIGAYLVMTYCWASFIFAINSARSEFNSFWAISICDEANRTITIMTRPSF